MKAEIDCETQALNRMLADRLAEEQRSPSIDVCAGEDVRFQSVDTFAVAEAKHGVVHLWDDPKHLRWTQLSTGQT